MPWAMKWKQTNNLDGCRDHLMIGPAWGPVLFDTRAKARAHVKERFGYIATRPDLQEEPHCWRMPQVVKVTVKITEVKS